MWGSAYSQNIYRWVDSEGNRHFTTTYEQIPEKYRDQVASPQPDIDHQKRGIAQAQPVKRKRAVAPASQRTTTSLDEEITLASRPAYRNEPSGFGRIQWGTSISRLRNLGFYEGGTKVGETIIYRRRGYTLQMGPVKLERICYGFWRGKFSNVLIYVKGHQDFERLKQMCFETFGKGYKPNPYVEKYFWGGDTTGILLEYRPLLDEGRLSLTSSKLANQREKNKERDEKELVEEPSS